METGTDGRFYDWHFDSDGDGKLNMAELMNYESVTYGDHDSGGGYPRRSTSSISSIWGILGVLLMIALFIIGFILFLVFPPLGALCFLGGYGLKEAL